jgi:16S rRNA (cytosine967-C5)-methyltransferase
VVDKKKLFPPIKRQLISSLHFLFENQSASSKVINYSFKQNKKWGSRDRRSFAEAFYTIVRHAGAYLHAAGETSFKDLQVETFAKLVDLYERGELEADSPSDEKFKYTVSADLITVLEEELSLEEKFEFLEASSKTAPVFLRVNTNLIDEMKCAQVLKELGFATEPVKKNCLRLLERKNVFTTDAFKKGFFEIQDGASQDVAPFLELEKGMRVADSCAGAGGKTLHISCMMENTGTIVAMDVFSKRLEELKKRARRAQCQNIEVKEIQGTKTVKRMEGKFDRLLLDVPCTGTGTYRRKPESKIFFSKAEHERLKSIQQEVIQLHSRLLKPGGKMVYATCSILPSENSRQVQDFLEKNNDFELEKEVLNKVGQNGFDGFYMARILKK